jgi:DNA repair protein SbcD/Mre11
VRFLHTSDWHLGRILHGVHLTDDQAYMLDQFVTLIDDVKPNAIVIAGDIYDRAVPPTEAVQLLDETLSRILVDYQVPVIMIAGNHDSPERLGFGNRLLARQGLHVVGQLAQNITPVVLDDQEGPVHFLPFTYAEPPLVRERLGVAGAMDHNEAMRVMVQHALVNIPRKARTVAIAHAFIAGGEQCESERPLSVGGSGHVSPTVFRPFHYTALGHLHNAQQAGAPHIRYAGSLMKYSFDEANHHKGIQIVELDGAGNVKTEQVCLTPRRDVRRVEGFLHELLQGADSAGCKEDYLMISLRDTDAILDVMGKLRVVYPHVLHIERPYLMSGGHLHKPATDHRRQSEAELFASFFEQTTGQALSGEQNAAMDDILEDLYRRNREAAS